MPVVSTPNNADPRAWRATSIDAPASWYHSLSKSAIAALAPLAYTSGSVLDLRAPVSLRAAFAEDTAALLDIFEHGRGFAIVSVVDLPSGDWPAAYWLIGQVLGVPFEQNVQGTLLYDVRDTGQDVRYGARFSVTNAESTFHTDNSFGADMLDYVGLLCRQPAKSGGESQLVSGFSVAAELQARHPDAWEVLTQPFHVDRRGGLRPGDEPTVRFPVFCSRDDDLEIRYLRYWIEVGHEKANQPLTIQQVEALDTLDRVAAEPGLRVQFMLKPGDIFFMNNRWLLHNRTGYEDYPEPERKRHYLRLWLKRTA